MIPRTKLTATLVVTCLSTACPFAPSNDGDEDAGVEDAGPDGPLASDATGSLHLVVRDAPGADPFCDVQIDVPARAGFRTFAAALLDDDESVLAFGMNPHGGGQGAEEPPLADVVTRLVFSGKPALPRTETLAFVVADALDLEVTTICDEDGTARTISVGAETTAETFSMTLSGFVGDDVVAQSDNLCGELTAPCTATEGTVDSTGQIVFTSGEGDHVEIDWELQHELQWSVGNDTP